MLLNYSADVYRAVAKIAFSDHNYNISSHRCGLKENMVEQTGELTITTIT